MIFQHASARRSIRSFLLGILALPVLMASSAGIASEDDDENKSYEIGLWGRFVNASTQTGNFSWIVHSINFGGAAVRWYKINTATNALVRSKTHFQSGTSSDFHASIAANDASDIYLTSTSASSTVCP